MLASLMQIDGFVVMEKGKCATSRQKLMGFVVWEDVKMNFGNISLVYFTHHF